MSAVLVIVVVVTGILRLLKQPVVIGYLLAGIAIGPVLFGIAKPEDHSFIELFSHL